MWQNGLVDLSEYEEHLEDWPAEMAEGETVNVVVAMPFLDHNPLAATE